MAYRLLNTGKLFENLLCKTLKQYNVELPRVQNNFYIT